MWVMSEISLPLLGTLRLRYFPGPVRRVLGRFFGRRRRKPDLTLQAASLVTEYARENTALFERAERLRQKADRLERDGTPSESAANRAERARMEVEAGLLALRDSFASSVEERRRAFDHEVGRLYPTLGIPGR
jgi:hypothetical protein